MHSHAPLFLDGINACIASVVSNKHCASTSLQQDDTSMLAACIKLNYECEAICLLAMHALVSNSAFTKAICSLCATICNACALECEEHVQMDHCIACAQQCRQCALQCSQLG
jgi:hypothetical protein